MTTRRFGRRIAHLRHTTALALVAAAGILSAGCGPGSSPRVEPVSTSEAETIAGPEGVFVDATEAAGLDFVHFNGMSGELYIVEEIGPGAALFDMDNDGDLDLYLPQGHMLGPGKTFADSTFPPPTHAPLTDRLYRNDLEILPDGSRKLGFIDITESSGIVAGGYGIGVATGDFDSDGFTDLYVTNWGANQLWRNLGDGRFEDVTTKAGVAGDELSTSASFVDVDGDGWLDLYIVNYAHFEYEKHQICTSPTGLPDYCGPLTYQPSTDVLYRNLGHGVFEDATTKSRIGTAAGTGLGVVCTDLDGDMLNDIYVANDVMPNLLWHNNGDWTFDEVALLAGCALNRDGVYESSMGVDAGDFDGDGDNDLILAHIGPETNTLYVNRGNGFFDDRSFESGIAPASTNITTYALAWIDFDNDGWLDQLWNNGAMTVLEDDARQGDPHPMRLPNSLIRNDGGTMFVDESHTARAVLSLREVGRGAAYGDLDNDGDTDAVFTNNAGPARLLVNAEGQDRPWLGLRLVGPSGRDMLGAVVEVVLADGSTIVRRSRADGSYCSANDPRVLIGLDGRPPIDRVRVRWPGQTIEEIAAPPLGCYTTLVEGSLEEAHR